MLRQGRLCATGQAATFFSGGQLAIARSFSDRSQATHEGIRIADRSHVFRITENDGSSVLIRKISATVFSPPTL
jgi:hypothetical protein